MSLRIHDLPNEERPREKMHRFGASALDDAELIALFLRTGMKGKSAIEIGRNLAKKYGSLGALGRLDLAELASEPGVGPAKASQLAAAFELGARVAREQLISTPLNAPAKVYECFAPRFAQLTQEELHVVLLDTRLHAMGTVSVSLGTVNETIAHPRDILRPVIVRAAYGFMLLHNHPSGDPSPSRADENLTRRIKDAAELLQVRFIDHIIIGRPTPTRPGWYSFRESGHLG